MSEKKFVHIKTSIEKGERKTLNIRPGFSVLFCAIIFSG